VERRFRVTGGVGLSLFLGAAYVSSASLPSGEEDSGLTGFVFLV